MFGCPNYGKGGCCPPNVPSVEECKRFIHEYRNAVVFHFEKYVKNPETRHRWTSTINKRLFAIEREVFLLGYWKAFMLYIDSCSMCSECLGSRIECRNKKVARPTPEAFGIDVYSTVKKVGYPIQVLRDYTEPMNRYAFLLIE
jgi:predicted metal-binding protein